MEAKSADFQPSTTIFKIGKYTFEYPKDHPKKKPINREAIKIIKKEHFDTLDISWGKYKRFKWDFVLKRVKDCEVQRICGFGNNDKNIPQTLSSINFFNLFHLDLGECHIESVENLPAGPNLNYLSLLNNVITSVKSLKKFHYPALKTLLLNENPIKQLGVERCDFSLDTYWLEKTIKQCLGQTCLFKMKHEDMKEVSIESIHRIYQEKMHQKLRQKFPTIENLIYLEPEDQFDSDSDLQLLVVEEQRRVEHDENQILHEEMQEIEYQGPDLPISLQGFETESEEDWPIVVGKIQPPVTKGREREIRVRRLSEIEREKHEKQQKQEKESKSKSGEQNEEKQEESETENENDSEEEESDSHCDDSNSEEESQESEDYETSEQSSSCWDPDLEDYEDDEPEELQEIKQNEEESEKEEASNKEEAAQQQQNLSNH